MSTPPNEPPPKYEPTSTPYPTGQYPPQQPYPGQYQQPYSYPSAYQQPGMVPNYQSTVVSQPQQVIIITDHFRPGPDPVTVECPNCRAHVVTTTRHEAGALTWILAGTLVLLGCWLGCCLIPFCVNDVQDVRHSCPNCHHHLATYTRL